MTPDSRAEGDGRLPASHPDWPVLVSRSEAVACAQTVPRPTAKESKQEGPGASHPGDFIAHRHGGSRQVTAGPWLITQRSLVQIQPPQPRQVAEIKGDDGQSAPLVFSADYEVLRPFRARAAAERRLSSNVFALWRAFPRSPRAGLLSPDFIGTIGARNRLQWRGLASAPWVARHFGSATQGSGCSRCSKVQTGA